jgi:hypothetical protein
MEQSPIGGCFFMICREHFLHPGHLIFGTYLNTHNMKKLLLGLLMIAFGFAVNAQTSVKFNYIISGFVSDPANPGTICSSDIGYSYTRNGLGGPQSVLQDQHTFPISTSYTFTYSGFGFISDEAFSFSVPCRNLFYSVTLAELNATSGLITKYAVGGGSIVLFVQKVNANEFNFFYQSPVGGI